MNEPPGPTPLETLNASGTIEVRHYDGSIESVRLRQATLGECEKLLMVQGDETSLACFYAGRDRAWFETLDPESQERVVVEGDRINLDFFERWCQRRMARQERVMPGSMEKLLQRALEPEAPPAPSRSLSSAPPSVRSRV